MPAQGQTILTSPKCVVAAWNMDVREGQDETSVLWKSARAVPDCWGWEYWSTKARASGRRVRSARRTLQLWESRRRVKARPMPEPAPVTMAVLLAMDWAMVLIDEGWMRTY